MRTSFPTLVAVVAIAGLSTAQIRIRRAGDAPRPATEAVQENPGDAVFYKAFYLDVGARSYEQAAALYKKFLASEGKTETLARRAANSYVNLLYRLDRLDQAREVEKAYASLLTGRRPGARGGADAAGGRRGAGRRGEGRRGGFGRGRGASAGAASVERFTQQIERLEKRLASAKEGGDEQAIERVTRQLERVRANLERAKAGGGDAPRRGGEGRGEGGRQRGRGRGMMRSFADMTKEEALESIDRMGSFVERMIERMADNGMEDRAEAMKKTFAKVKELVKAGKLAEADKARQDLFGGFRRRR